MQQEQARTPAVPEERALEFKGVTKGLDGAHNLSEVGFVESLEGFRLHVSL